MTQTISFEEFKARTRRLMFDRPEVVGVTPIRRPENDSEVIGVEVEVETGVVCSLGEIEALFGVPQKVIEHDPYSIEIGRAVTAEASRWMEPSSIDQWRRCHNEPVPVGVQVQPRGANHVGTAGALCTYEAADGSRQVAILTNEHVLTGANGTMLHQPSTSLPAVGVKVHRKAIEPRGVNYVDMALADCRIGDWHTFGVQILGGAGRTQGEGWKDARPTMAVEKSGRTTGFQSGVCVATGRSVRVGYGSFTAIFEDQDVFRRSGGQFSGPGDSGSGIRAADDQKMVSLLFAGGGSDTIGSPMRYVTQHRSLRFDLP